MATNMSRSMSDDLMTGMIEGGYETGAPDRSPTDFGHQQKLKQLHAEQYGGIPGGAAIPLSLDEREVIPVQFPVTHVGVQP